MNIPRTHPAPSRRDQGFTLVEIMVGIGIFTLVIAAMVSIQLLGMRFYALAATKITTTTDARQTINAIRDAIRSGNTVLVGQYTVTNGAVFIQTPSGLPQIGNAVEILSTNGVTTNSLIIYQDASGPKPTLVSLQNFTSGRVLANYVINSDCFRAEDFQGNVLTNYQNNPVINVTLQFSQAAFPQGANNFYEYYRLQTRIAQRIK